MVDTQTTTNKLQNLAIKYQKTKNIEYYNKLYVLMREYLTKKTISGVTDNITLYDRDNVTNDVCSDIWEKIDNFDFEKYKLTAIITQLFKQYIIAEYKRRGKFNYSDNKQLEKIMESKIKRDLTIY